MQTAIPQTHPASPLQVIPLSILRMLTGQMRYPRERVNQIIELADGRRYRVFREIVLRSDPPAETGGVFRVWFYTYLPIRQTIRLSQSTKLFFVGMPGFRGKMWLLNDKTGEFGGIYQFATVSDANNYAHSFAMGLSKRRSRPGLFRLEVYARTDEASLFRAQEDPLPAQVHSSSTHS